MAAVGDTQHGVRPEIQALRALAVALVVVFHFWPEAMPGGFAGVDVFFAVSGFLITTQLLHEVERSGRIALPRFWARRARRLLPAALLTLLTCALVTILVVPEAYWTGFLGDIASSTAYVQNWHLADKAVDYHAQTEAVSPAKHFWSLSAEEQFYLVWPVLLAIPALLLRKVRSTRRWPLGVALAAVTAASFAASLAMTSGDPSRAYFVTPTRAWEFGLGGLMALALPVSRAHPHARAALSWAGLTAILAGGLFFSATTPWPGVAALVPVLGALAVIHAGLPGVGWSPSPLLRTRPAQWTGDLSYAIYLWHWPLLVFAPYVVAEATGAVLPALLVLTLLCAWVSKVTVEDPLRRGRLMARLRPAATLGLAGATTALVIAVPLAGAAHVRQEIRAAEAEVTALLAAQPRCFGAAARDPATPECRRFDLGHRVVPSPVAASAQGNAPCVSEEVEHGVDVCRFGVPSDRAEHTVALIGDSHASHWRAALAVLARRNRWHGVSITHTGCAFSQAFKVAPRPQAEDCVRWNHAVPRWLGLHPEVRLVFTSGIVGGAVTPEHGRSRFATEVRGFQRAWASLPDSVEHVIVLRDVPRMRGGTIGCVEQAMRDGRPAGTACAEPRDEALRADPQVQATGGMGSQRFASIDLSDLMCTPRRCPAVIGGALVHKDVHHLTRVFATTLGPVLQRRTDDVMQGWAG